MILKSATGRPKSQYTMKDVKFKKRRWVVTMSKLMNLIEKEVCYYLRSAAEEKKKQITVTQYNEELSVLKQR